MLKDKSKFILEYDQMLQGSFEVKERNVAYIFQVNCPGCFMYGFPLLNHWYEQYKGSVGFIGVSTCFEDYEYNNVQNTIDLLKHGKMVGETLKYFSQHNFQTYPGPPKFPVVFDATISAKEYLTEQNVLAICQTIPGFEKCADDQQNEVKQRVIEHYSDQEKMALTFTQNQLKGTPSYVFFDEKFTIIQSHFGQLPNDELESYFD